VPAPTAQYCSILDIEFEIDNDEIQRAEKEKLGVLGTFLTKYPDTTAVIEGHTDNVGSADYNLKLSQHRADSVVSYLVDTYRIAAGRLKAVGYGDSRPLASNSTQEGKRQNRRIDAVIACVTDIEGLAVAPSRMTLALLLEFDANSAEVRAQYHDQLASVATFLKNNPMVTATVEGHTGNLQANAAASREIAQRRAANVVAYLVDKLGVEPSRLVAEGFGKTRRFAYNTDSEGQQDNRRVNIIINYPKR
jgi:OOP family OmpA-OmpF porin